MIKTILRDDIYELDDMVRYNGTRTVQKKEVVSQHCHWVMFYCNLLFRGLYYKPVMTCTDEPSQRYLILNFRMMYSFLMWQLVYHDFEENITGDVLYRVKYDPDYGDDIKTALNKIKLKKVEAMPRDLLYYDFSNCIKTDLFPELETDNLTIEQKSICLNLIKLADWLSVLKYSYVEIQLGNKNLFESRISRATDGIEACITQLELLTSNEMQPLVDTEFLLELRSELIEIKSKLQIL